MKKIISVLLSIIVCLLILGTAGATSGVYELIEPSITLAIPQDYVVYDQKGVISGNANAAGKDQASIDDVTAWMRTDEFYLEAEQIDGYDNIDVCFDSYSETVGIKDLTQYVKSAGRSEKEILDELDTAINLRTANDTDYGYTNETCELLTINGETYAHSVGYFDDEYGKQYVDEYHTVKNGKWIRIEMYINGNQAPTADQLNTMDSVMKSVAYKRGAAGFLSQAMFGMNGAMLLPFVVIGIVIIAAVIVLLVVLLKRRKKKHLAAQSAPSSGDSSAPPQGRSPKPPIAPITPSSPVQQAPIEPQPPVQQNPIQQVPVQQAPIESQPPVQQNPIQQVPVQQVPVVEEQPSPALTQESHVIQPVFKEDTPAQQQPPVQQPPVQPEEEQDVYKLLEELSELRKRGVITEEDFRLKKKELLKRL
ncbi:MAG: hypothetical protein VB082_02250 [Christensenella sp.]|nr:hypothetical protein [Christensenella sp.]